MKVLNIFKENIYLIVILIIGAFLRFDRLGELMVFIGDQGWFYLSARDMLILGNIPLVGITSSHIWLHQGPLWTYILALALWVSNFNPVSGAVLTALIGVGSIFLIYKIGTDFFSRKFGLVTALIYATSPLIIIHERLAYHTSPIPFVVLLLIYSLLKVLKGKSIFFPLVALCLALLYNFELATIVFIPVVLFFFGFGFYRKEKWVKPLKNHKILILSLLALLVPMIPILIYDFQHGFPQTLKFGAWFVYKLLSTIGIIDSSANSDGFINVLAFFFERYKLLIYPGISYKLSIPWFLFILSIYFIGRKAIPKINSIEGVIFLSTTVPFIGLLVSGTRSEAYLPMLFPGLILCLSYALLKLEERVTYAKNLAYAAFIIFFALNTEFIYSHNYLMEQRGGFGLSFAKRKQAVEKILKIANGRSYNLVFKGPGNEFESSTMNYEYLAWWIGKNPSAKEKQDMVFVIEERQDEISVKIK